MDFKSLPFVSDRSVQKGYTDSIQIDPIGHLPDEEDCRYVMTRRRDTAEATARAFAEHSKGLQNYLARHLTRTEDLRDLVQEIFLRFLKIERERSIESPQAYLYGIASNVVQERRRVRLRQRVSFNSPTVEHADEHPAHVRPDEVSESLMLERQIEAVAASLTPVQLKILTYWRRDGLSFKEIGELLGLSPNTVKQYAVRAVASIRMGCQ
jgi:RNA polymerase sigma factor (sigma-70 family)